MQCKRGPARLLGAILFTVPSQSGTTAECKRGIIQYTIHLTTACKKHLRGMAQPRACITRRDWLGRVHVTPDGLAWMPAFGTDGQLCTDSLLLRSNIQQPAMLVPWSLLISLFRSVKSMWNASFICNKLFFFASSTTEILSHNGQCWYVQACSEPSPLKCFLHAVVRCIVY